MIIGVDECGRGCLAGEVIAAAVAWDGGREIEYEGEIYTLNDSKKLTPKRRKILSDVIKKTCPWGIGSASVKEINELNILHASLLAMYNSIKDISDYPGTDSIIVNLIIVDGDYLIPNLSARQKAIPKADATEPAVMAASIIAKVYRDSLMKKYHIHYPEYDWKSNKGYGTKKHIEAIKKHGLTPLHRNYKKFLEKIGVKYGT